MQDDRGMRAFQPVQDYQPDAKGVSRRIVVVPAGDESLYEKVIYVVRDQAAARGVTAEEVLLDAQSLLKPADDLVLGEEMNEPDCSDADTEHVSKLLFALSGISLALSGCVLLYWFFAM